MAGWAGAVLGGLTAGAGAGGSALSSAREAKKSRKFQKKVMKNAYQWTMADMRSAGLNPILAYQKGATGSPGANMGQTPDFGAAISGGVKAATSAARMPSEVTKNKAAATLAGRQQYLVDAQARLTDATSSKTIADAKLVQYQLPREALIAKYYESEYAKAMTGPLRGAEDTLGPINKVLDAFKFWGTKVGPTGRPPRDGRPRIDTGRRGR